MPCFHTLGFCQFLGRLGLQFHHSRLRFRSFLLHFHDHALHLDLRRHARNLLLLLFQLQLTLLDLNLQHFRIGGRR